MKYKIAMVILGVFVLSVFGYAVESLVGNGKVDGIYYADTLTELQAQINAMEDGGTLFLGEGSHTTSAAIYVNRSNITIIGYGATINVNPATNLSYVFYITGHDVGLYGIEVAGNRYTNTTPISTGSGVYGYKVERMTITDVYSRDHYEHGIRCDFCNEVIYSNNRAESNRWMGLEFYSTNNSIMENNVVVGSQGQNIEISTNCYGNIITHNQLYRSGGNGIEILNSYDNVIDSNIIKDTGNLTPVNPSLPGGHGIDIDGDRNQVTNNRIIGGVRDGVYHGINTNGHYGNIIRGNVIDIRDRGYYGIYVRDSTNTTLEDNTIDAKEHPIRLRMAQNIRVDGGTLRCHGSADDGIRIDDDAVTSSSYISMYDLAVYDCTFAINEVGSGDYFIYDGIDSSHSGGFSIAATHLTAGDTLS